MTDFIVTEQLQEHLVAQGIGQLPGTPPSLELPAIFDSPPQGAPEPRYADDDGSPLEQATIALLEISDAPENELGAWLQETFVEIVVRAHSDTDAKLLHRRIRDELAPITAHGGRAMWTMGQLLVQRSYQSHPEQPLPRQDPRFYDRTCIYAICCSRKALAGLPYVP